MQDPVWQGADAAVFYQNMVRSWVTSHPLEEPLVALPIKLHSTTAVLKTAVRYKLIPTLRSLFPLNHTCPPLFFHPGTWFADPLPPLHGDCQHSNPSAYCRPSKRLHFSLIWRRITDGQEHSNHFWVPALTLSRERREEQGCPENSPSVR